MSEIEDLVKSLNIPPEKLAAFATKVRANPLSAVGAFFELGLSMEFFAKLYAIIKADPSALAEYAKGLGVDESAVAEAKKQASKLFGRDEVAGS